MSRRARNRLDKRAEALSLARTGWPPGMLQDDSRELSRWLASTPEAPRLVRERCAEIAEEPVVWHLGEPEPSDEAPMVLIDGSPVDLREGWPTIEDLNTKA